MKRFYLLLAVMSLGCLALSSCSDKSENIDNNEYNDGAEEAVSYTGYVVDTYVTGYTRVEGKKIYDNIYGELPENSIIGLRLTCEGDLEEYYSSIHLGEYDQQFFEFAEKNNEYGTFDSYTRIGENISIPYSITNIKIWAVNDYNENYTAGNELTDIARLTYTSFEPYISNNYKVLPEMELTPLQEGGIPMYDPTYELWVFPYYNVTLPQNGENPMILPSGNYDYDSTFTFACVSFLEAPATTTPQFEVSVTFEDGTVISGSFEIEIGL